MDEAAETRSAPRHASKTLPGIVFAYLSLAVIVAVACFSLYRLTTKDIRVETKTVLTTPKTAAGLLTGLGAPAQSIPGEQINENLKGATCSVYQPSDGLIFVCR